MKANYRVYRCFDEVSPESAAIGECSDCGEVWPRQEMTLDQVISELRDCSQTSTAPARPENLTGREWAMTEPSVDYQTGTERTESVHIAHVNGGILSGRRLWKLWKLAGIVR